MRWSFLSGRYRLPGHSKWIQDVGGQLFRLPPMSATSISAPASRRRGVNHDQWPVSVRSCQR